jgi:hypothetical protein
VVANTALTYTPFIARIRENTVTGMLQGAGLAGIWHHSRAHSFFAYRRGLDAAE